MARPPGKKTPVKPRARATTPAKPAGNSAPQPTKKEDGAPAAAPRAPATPTPRPSPTPKPAPRPSPTPRPSPAPTPSPAPSPAPAPVRAPATLSIEDIKLIRARLDAFQPGGTVGAATPTDGIVALMAEKLAQARAADAARIAALEARLAELDKTIAAAGDDRDAELSDALGVTDTLLAEVARLTANKDTGTSALADAQAQLARATREVTELRTAADPKATGVHVLGAETVASLLNDFVGSFTSKFSGLQVSSGDVLLKAGFAQLGQGAGFVLPTAHAPPGEQPVLHDIRLRLDPKGSAGPA